MPNIHLDDTIAAIATPIGEGGISVIRVSGPEAFEIAGKMFRPLKGALNSFQSHTIHGGQAVDENSRVLDQVLASIFRAPHSYTGQDVIEISSHGGLIVSKKILECLIAAGARHAEPGEFTRRAFLNGKIDLTQAEAVLDLIKAKSDKAAGIAIRQLGGTLSLQFKNLKDELMKIYAHMEAFLDFPEEHLEVYDNQAFHQKYDAILNQLRQWVAGFERGALIREGALVVIVGRPNVGKSSLFNALLARDRALVSEFPGTTRDSIEEAIEIEGLYLRLVDTAGLAPELETAGHPVDRLSMERTRKALAEADAFLYMVDRSQPLTRADTQVYEEVMKAAGAEAFSKPVLCVANKSDLPGKINPEALKKLTGLECIEISASRKTGFDLLEKKLSEIFTVSATEGEQITRLRHKQALEEAFQSLELSRQAFLNKDSLEFVVADLKRALNALQELVGEVYNEDLLDVIFSEFCIGK